MNSTTVWQRCQTSRCFGAFQRLWSYDLTALYKSIFIIIIIIIIIIIQQKSRTEKVGFCVGLVKG